MKTNLDINFCIKVITHRMRFILEVKLMKEIVILGPEFARLKKESTINQHKETAVPFKNSWFLQDSIDALH